jgi:DNA-binding XRE family transcriptional regulator
MAEKANVFRKATAELLHQELSAMRITVGIMIKAYRAYKRPGKPSGYTQDEIAQATDVAQPQLSLLENGKAILPDPQLQCVLTQCGFDVTESPGQDVLELLKLLRDRQPKIAGVIKDKPR